MSNLKGGDWTVQRANGSARVEFRNLYSGQLTVSALADSQHFYNHIRPRQFLARRTPMESLDTCKVTRPSLTGTEPAQMLEHIVGTVLYFSAARCYSHRVRRMEEPGQCRE